MLVGAYSANYKGPNHGDLYLVVVGDQKDWHNSQTILEPFLACATLTFWYFINATTYH